MPQINISERGTDDRQNANKNGTQAIRGAPKASTMRLETHVIEHRRPNAHYEVKDEADDSENE